VKTARAWKDYYRRERESLGERGLLSVLERAPRIELPPSGALIFPHTRLEASGELVAAAALACVRSGRAEVLALGVLHGAREQDQELVGKARAGEPRERALLRRVHGPGVPGDEARWEEEFSLDGFQALLELAARVEGRPLPRLIQRFPFLTGEHPFDLPGLQELREIRERGAALVATADPIHHGEGYGTPEADWLPREAATTKARARASIEEGLSRLAKLDFAGFLAHAAREKSDFRDPGPVLAALLARGSSLRSRVASVALVDYTEALGAKDPTWVAGALSVLEQA